MQKYFATIKKIFKIFSIFIVITFIGFLFSRGRVYDKNELQYGVTYSAKQARDLGLDWQETFIKILDELKVKKVRLVAYWDEIELEQDKYNFNDLDWQISEAAKRNAEVIITVGGRVPRWPECHLPNWAKEKNDEEKKEDMLAYITDVINHYKDYDAVKYWQVENEPFLINFGECPKPDANFLDKEIALVRSLDNRQIIITDSGELSLWLPAAKRADIFGTTMYRDTYSKNLNSYIHYPIAPGFFRFKKNIVGWFADPKSWIVIELQAEPWGPKAFQNLSKEERDRTMDLDKFKENLEFGRLSGFKEFYLWGAEYWYWEKTKNNNAEIWEEAKTLFK